MRTAGILAAAALSLAALSNQANADAARAWTVAKAGLPADTKIVIGVDLAAIQKTQLFAVYYPKLRDQPEVSDTLSVLKDACKLDPVSVVQGAVIGLSADQHDGAVYVSLAGVDQPKLLSCFRRAHDARRDDIKYAIKQDGNITEVSKNGETTFLGWVGKDVLVVSLHPMDRASLVKWMGGKGALTRSDLGKTLARTNTAAAVWGAGVGSYELQPGATARSGYGAMTFSKGTIVADVHAVMESAAQASSMATTTNQQLEAFKGSGQLPPDLAAVVKAVTISSDKDELRVKASLAEKDLVNALETALKGAGGP